MTGLRVVVVDDQELVRSGFRLILERAGFVVVGEAADGLAAIAALARGRRPRVPPAAMLPAVSGVEAISPAEDNRPLFVGERTNVIGSRKFKELVVAERFDELPEHVCKACPELPPEARAVVASVIASARSEWIRATATLAVQRVDVLADVDESALGADSEVAG